MAKQSRRDFLKASGFTIAGLAAGLSPLGQMVTMVVQHNLSIPMFRKNQM